jgi:hypothetical protein
VHPWAVDTCRCIPVVPRVQGSPRHLRLRNSWGNIMLMASWCWSPFLQGNKFKISQKVYPEVQSEVRMGLKCDVWSYTGGAILGCQVGPLCAPPTVAPRGWGSTLMSQTRDHEIMRLPGSSPSCIRVVTSCITIFCAILLRISHSKSITLVVKNLSAEGRALELERSFETFLFWKKCHPRPRAVDYRMSGFGTWTLFWNLFISKSITLALEWLINEGQALGFN